MDELAKLLELAGLNEKRKSKLSQGSNISMTGMEKRRLEKKYNIQPGTKEWFQLWFSKPYLTGERPIGEQDES